jgi:hypothetical protein
MGCFKIYEKAIMKSTGVSDNLDAALALSHCVWKGLIGSGQLYHKATGLTKTEEQAATALAAKVKAARATKNPSSPDQIIDLADEAYDFAISVSVARGAVHKGPPKVT